MASVYRFTRLLGTKPARAILLTGLPTGAEEALKFGLVAAVQTPERFLDEAISLASRIASPAPLPYRSQQRHPKSSRGTPDEAGTGIQL